jgi:hypothetical protein
VADISHAQLQQIASPKLAVDCQVEHSKIAAPTRDLQAHTDRPSLFQLEWRFLAYKLALVPRFASSECNGFHYRLLLLGSREFALAPKGS